MKEKDRTAEIERPTCEVYRGQHRSVTYEVKRHWNSDGKEVWTFYLFLAAEQFPKEVQPGLWTEPKISDFGSVHLPYPEALTGLEWHCGMTWYSKESQPEDPLRSIKVGCDYQHYWDEGYSYSRRSVEADAKRCIDSLWAAYPNLVTIDQLWKERRQKFRETHLSGCKVLECRTCDSIRKYGYE